MYARGMSAREIVGHLRELYGIDVSPDLVSVVTDAVLDEIAAWQARPLEPVYPLVFCTRPVKAAVRLRCAEVWRAPSSRGGVRRCAVLDDLAGERGRRRSRLADRRR